MRVQLRSILQSTTHSTTKYTERTIAITKLLVVSTTLAIASIIPTIALPGSAHAEIDCGSIGVAKAGSAWLSSSGVNVCNHPGDGTNVCNAVSGAPGDAHCSTGNVWSGTKWQCVELVNRLYLTKGWITATWYGNGGGSDALTNSNHVPSGITVQNNGSISYINSGDVISLNNRNSDDGHAGIIDTISGITYNIINQNAQLSSSAYLASGSLSGGNASLNMNAWSGYSVNAIAHHTSSQSTTAKPAALQYGSEMDVFKRGGDNAIWKDTWNSPSWSGWNSLGGVLASDPTAIQYGSEMDVYAINSGGVVYKDTWGGTSWSGWNPLSSSLTFTGNPSAVQYGSEMDVYAKATDSHIYKDTWTGTSWTGWNSLGGSISGNPKAMIYGSEMDVWARGTDNALWKDTWNGSTWGGFSSLGGVIANDPIAIQYNSEMDVYVINSGGNAFKQTWNGTSWSGYVSMPGATLAGSPAALQYGSEMEIYARGSSNSYIYKDSWNGTSWSGWNSLGGNEATDPTAIQYSTEMDVYDTNYASNTDKDTWLPANNNWSGFTGLL